MNNYSLLLKMIPKNTAKIIRFLLRDTEKTGYNINQIAKIIKISVGSSFKILKDLEKNKIVSSQTIGNACYYKLNLDNSETIKLCELLLLEEKRNLIGYAKLYSEDIQKFNKAELIILFGSILIGKKFNDVDVLFLTNKVKEVNAFCLELSKVRTKPIVPLILKKEDLVREIKNRKEAVVSIIKDGIVLKGESLFVKVIKNVKN